MQQHISIAKQRLQQHFCHGCLALIQDFQKLGLVIVKVINIHVITLRMFANKI